MGIVRLASDLPPDVEVELKKETAGETVKWAGRASHFAEKIEGWIIILVGLGIAVANIGGPLALIGVLADFAERGQLPNGGYGMIGAGVLAFSAGAAIAMMGLRFINSARPIVWAITESRLVRLIGGADGVVRSWNGPDILHIERLNWDEPPRRALAITARGHKRGEVAVVMVGKVDLEAADRALGELAA